MAYTPRVFPDPTEGLKGIELRDYFAAHALTGMLGSPSYKGSSPADLAMWAYAIAEAMLEERY